MGKEVKMHDGHTGVNSLKLKRIVFFPLSQTFFISLTHVGFPENFIRTELSDYASRPAGDLKCSRSDLVFSQFSSFDHSMQ